MVNRLVFAIIGAAIATAVIFVFFWPSVEERTVITYKTETVYDQVSETIDFDSISSKVTSLSDSIDFYRNLYQKELAKEDIIIVKEGEPIQAPLRRYSGFEPTLYGNISYNSLVVGKQLEMRIRHDLSIPIVTNTIEKKSTVVLKPKGIYGTGGINSNFHYSVGAIYLNDRSLFGYEFTPQLNLHELKAGFRIF